MSLAGGKHSASGAALSSINEGDEHVSLMDLLCHRNAWLEEEELWAVCRECCLAVQTLSTSSETFQTFCVTPDTLAFDIHGAVCLLDFEVDDLLCKPPEFYHVGNSYKGHIYSLGTTMLMAAHYNMEGGKPRHSRRLTQLLADMTAQDYDSRADIDAVVGECDVHMRGRSSRELCCALVAASVNCRPKEAPADAVPDQVKGHRGGQRETASPCGSSKVQQLEQPCAHVKASAYANNENVCSEASQPSKKASSAGRADGDLRDSVPAVSTQPSPVARTRLVVSAENLNSQQKRQSAFTSKSEIKLTSAFTPINPATRGDLSVRVYGHSDPSSPSSSVSSDTRPKLLRVPAQYSSSATHFTPIVLRSERKLLDGAEIKDKDAAKKIKELKKNLLRNLHPPNNSNDSAAARSDTAAHQSAAATGTGADGARHVQAPSVKDGAADGMQPEVLSLATPADQWTPVDLQVHDDFRTHADLQLAVPPDEYADKGPAVALTSKQHVGPSLSRAALENANGASNKPVNLTIGTPRTAARAQAPLQQSWSASTLPQGVHDLDFADSKEGYHDMVIAAGQGSTRTSLDSMRADRRNAHGGCTGQSVPAAAEANHSKGTVSSSSGNAATAVECASVGEVRTCGHVGTRKKRGHAGSVKMMPAQQTSPGHHQEGCGDTEGSKPEDASCHGLSAEWDLPDGRGDEPNAAGFAAAQERLVLPPPSPSLSKDSGVGGLGNSGGDSVLMDRLLSSDGMRTRAILGRVLCLLRDEFSYEGYLDNGVEDLAMAEYVASLGSLKWETFVSAVSEKYCDLFWQDELLIKLYETINGKAPVITRRPLTVMSTAHVVRIDEPQAGRSADSGAGLSLAAHVHSPFRPISTALTGSHAGWSTIGTDASQTVSRPRSSHMLIASPQQHATPASRSTPAAARSRSVIDDSTVNRMPLKLSRKRSASAQELASPDGALLALGGGTELYHSVSDNAVDESRREQRPSVIGPLSLVLRSPLLHRGSRCSSVCSSSSGGSRMTVIRVRGQQPEADSTERRHLFVTAGHLLETYDGGEPRHQVADVGTRQFVPTSRAQTATQIVGRTSAVSFARGRQSVLRGHIAQTTQCTDITPTANDPTPSHAKENAAHDNGPGRSRPSFSGSRLRDGEEENEESARLIDVIYYAAGLQHMSSESLQASIKLAESTARADLYKLLASTDQQLAVQKKQRSKALKYCMQLQAAGGATGSRKDKAFDRKAVLEKAVSDVTEASDKLQLLVSTKRHAEMLLAEQCGLDESLLLALSKASHTQPLVLPPTASTYDDALLQFQEARGLPSFPIQMRQGKVLHAGTASGLSLLLYARSSIVDQHIHHFLICYRYFMSPSQLLDFIVEKYLASLMPQQPQAEVNDNALPGIVLSGMEIAGKIQTRSLDMLQAWVEGYYTVDFKYGDKLLLVDLRAFYHHQVALRQPTRAEAMFRLLSDYEKGICTDLSHISMLVRDDADAVKAASQCSSMLPKKMMPKLTVTIGKHVIHYTVGVHGLLPSGRPLSAASELPVDSVIVPKVDNFSVDDHSAQTLAEQLTVIEQTFFDYCHPVHFMNSKAQGVGIFSASANQDGNRDGVGCALTAQNAAIGQTSLFVGSYTQDAIIQYMIEHSHSVSRWVAAELVSCSNAKAQLALLKKFIYIARICKEIRNYATCVAIVDGLENIIVKQLPVWKDISFKTIAQLRSVKMLLESDPMVLTKDADSARLSSCCSAVSLPTIPSILIFVVHVQQAELGSFTLANGMFKWNKLRLLSTMVDQIRKFKQKRYDFEVDSGLSECLSMRIKRMCDLDLHALATSHDINFQRPRSTVKWMHSSSKQRVA